MVLRTPALMFAFVVIASCAANPPLVVTPFTPEDLASGWTVIGGARYQRTAQRVVLESGSVRSVDVGIVTGNAFAAGDWLTLTVMSPVGRVFARVTRRLPVGTNGWVRFPVSVTTPRGSQVVVRLAEEDVEMFGWRYRANPQRAGRAILLGRDDGQFDFLCRINP